MYIKEITQFDTVHNVSVVQFTLPEPDTLTYISAATAIEQKFISVEEISESGNVNRLIVRNTSEKFVFFMDGDILEGAKQNRVLNSSVYIAPQSETTIPVSCVEAGRWHRTSSEFKSSGFVAPGGLRSGKAGNVHRNLNRANRYDSDQSEVWGSVAEYSREHKIVSDTSDFLEVSKRLRIKLLTALEKITPHTDCNGLALFIGKELHTLDVFNRKDIFAEYFPKLVQAGAMDAQSAKPGDEIERAEAQYKTLTTLDAIEETESTGHKGVALGKEYRYRTQELEGFKLICEDKLVHLALLNKRKKITTE